MPCPCLWSSSWSVHRSHARELSLAPCIGEQRVGGGQQQTYGHKGLKWTPGPSLCHLWVDVWAHAGWPCGSDRALCRQGLSSPTVQRGRLVLLPVSTVVSYLQQGLFSKSSLKWLCLSSLLLYELKTKQNKTTKQKTKPQQL